jgi:hypothetical protein
MRNLARARSRGETRGEARPRRENPMAAKKGNRSKRKVSNRSKVKRVGAKTKRARSIKRKRNAKRGPK